MWAMLLPLLSTIGGGIGKYFEQLNQIEMKRLENQLAIESEKSKLIAQGMIVDGQRNIEQIKATSQWFKQFIYCVIISPIVITCFDPGQGIEIFKALGIVPEWYIYPVVTISLAIWGINSDKVQTILQARRDYKLEMAKVKIDRKAFYAALRSTKGYVTPEDVKENEKVFDKLDKE